VRKVITLSNMEALRAGDIRVDREGGAIYGVSVLTAGPTLGHLFSVDEVMLDQAVKFGNESKRGVKCRLTHPELMGGFFSGPMRDSIEVMLGRVRNFRREADRVRGDVFFGKYAARADGPKGNVRDYLLDLAEEDPEVAGLSLAFYPAEGGHEQVGEETFGRMSGLKAVDFVGDPGANPGGLLSEGEKRMNPKLRKYLESIGLAAGTSDADAVTFFMALTGDKLKAAALIVMQEGEVAPEGEAPTIIPDVTPEEGETEEAFKTRFMADVTMTEKYPDDTSREMRATDIWAEHAAAAAPAPAPEAEVVVPAMRAKIRTEALVADRTRRTAIATLAAEKGIDQMWSRALADNGVSLVMFSKLVKDVEVLGPVNISVGADRNLDTLGPALADAVSLRAGLFRPQKLRSGADLDVGKPHARAEQFRHMSLMEMGRELLVGLGLPGRSVSRAEVIRLCFNRFALAREAGKGGTFLAMGTTDFPFILANVLGKSLRQSYGLAETTWDKWAKETSAPDFKQVSRVILSSAPALVAIAEGGEYTYGSMLEGRELYSLGKYGKALKFTREMMINDDLGAFNVILPRMGAKAKYLEDVVAYAILTGNAALADGIALFNLAGHNNDFAGGINVVTLGGIFAAMATQTDLDGATLVGNDMQTLITPKGQQIAAKQFLTAIYDPATAVNSQTPNPFAGTLEPVGSPHLDATSAETCYLAADPLQVDTVDMCFLEGERTPVLEEEEDFDTDCRKYKVRHQMVAKAIDFRGLVRITGIGTGSFGTTVGATTTVAATTTA